MNLHLRITPSFIGHALCLRLEVVQHGCPTKCLEHVVDYDELMGHWDDIFDYMKVSLGAVIKHEKEERKWLAKGKDELEKEISELMKDNP